MHHGHDYSEYRQQLVFVVYHHGVDPKRSYGNTSASCAKSPSVDCEECNSGQNALRLFVREAQSLTLDHGCHNGR